jgi:hypothetical protein
MNIILILANYIYLFSFEFYFIERKNTISIAQSVHLLYFIYKLYFPFKFLLAINIQLDRLTMLLSHPKWGSSKEMERKKNRRERERKEKCDYNLFLR